MKKGLYKEVTIATALQKERMAQNTRKGSAEPDTLRTITKREENRDGSVGTLG